jgi:hypothetical protein
VLSVVPVLQQPVFLALRFMDVLGVHGGAQQDVGCKTTEDKPRPI